MQNQKQRKRVQQKYSFDRLAEACSKPSHTSHDTSVLGADDLGFSMSSNIGVVVFYFA